MKILYIIYNMTSTAITTISSSSYNIQPNTFEYYFLTTTNVAVFLPQYGLQQDNKPINLVNIGTTTTTVNDSNSVVLDVILPGFMIKFVFNITLNIWEEVSNNPAKTGVSNVAFSLIPILVGDPQNSNNQYFGASGSSNGAASDFYFPFSTGGLQYWLPSTTGIEFLTVVSPLPMVPTQFLVQLRGAGTTNYFNQPIIQGSNDNTTWTSLYTLTLSQSQTSGSGLVVQKFINTNSYLYLRFYVPGTVGTVAGLGVFNLQYYGYFS
jgi:hypothetical protein